MIVLCLFWILKCFAWVWLLHKFNGESQQCWDYCRPSCRPDLHKEFTKKNRILYSIIQHPARILNSIIWLENYFGFFSFCLRLHKTHPESWLHLSFHGQWSCSAPTIVAAQALCRIPIFLLKVIKLLCLCATKIQVRCFETMSFWKLEK